MDGQDLIVLDFDGVLCDSAYENAATAWRCCRALWPADFAAPQVTGACAQQFEAARPWLETGWQSVVMTWCIQRRMPFNDYTSDLEAALPRILAAMGCTRPQLMKLFRQTREEWLVRAREEWLGLHRFYPGIKTVMSLLRQNCAVRILTTKESHFIRELLALAAVDFPDDAIFGLDRIVNKQHSLAEWLALHRFRTISFVEDRYATLAGCENNPALANLRLFLAGWGYNTAEQRTAAAADPRISLLESAGELPELVNP